MKPIYTEYEHWEPVVTELPPRSRLFPLVPVGIGTGQAESLTSYVMRLAEAHCLYVTTLYSLLLQPAVRAEAENQGPERSRIVLKGRHGITHSGHTWNGVSGVASCHVRALERLTGMTRLHLLTWLPWEAALSHHLRQHRAWCPACFGQWRNEGQTIYEPLLWTLQIVRVCPIHHCSLVEVCPCCQRENKLLSNHARAGYCSRCRQRLNDVSEDRLPARHQTETEQLRIAESAAEMIARAPDLPRSPSKTLITQNLRDLINYLGGNCKAFGEAIGRYHTVVFSWRDGRTIPRLETLMEICHRLHLPIVDFLTAPIEMKRDKSEMKELFFQNLSGRNRQKTDAGESRGRQAVDSLLTQQPPIRTLPKENKDRRMRRLLERELSEECPRSPSALAKEAGYRSDSVAERKSPKLWWAVIAKRKEYKGEQDRKLLERGRRVIADALNEVPMPMMKEIAARVGITTAEELYRRFPNECRALSQRRAQLWESWQVEMETNLRAALRDEPPRPLRHVAASYGYGLCAIYDNHHEVCLAISARYAAYRKEETPRRRLALKERIRQIVVDLQRGGNNPSADQIKPLAPDLQLSTIKRILREIDREVSER
ncbi:MAG: TniQ family protein [Pyrinomonadaceae bacterium]